MKIRKLAACLFAVTSLASLTVNSALTSYALPSGQNTMRDMTTMEIVEDMGIGINLGNTFESCGDWIGQYGDGSVTSYETAWGSPSVTEDLIKGYANAGFDTLRIPVAWSNMMTDTDQYTINADYLKRVTQVVDWALDADLYVIMNLHWDGGWLDKVPTDFDGCLKKYSLIWTQLADSFKDYGDHLIFESQNEELGWNDIWNPWGGTDGKEESYSYVNTINQKFVDIIRQSGGNNEKRHLLISGYQTDVSRTCDPLFKMPDDPAGRCAVSVHYYTPAGFAILTQDESWGKASSTWGTDAEYAELNSNMDMLKTTFVDNGIPVIIGEYGCPKENKEEESVRRFLSSVCEAALSRDGICPVLWDITDLHYNRTSFEMTDKELQNQLLEVKEKYTSNEEIKGDVNSDGAFNVSDAVMLQKYLVNSETLTNNLAADLNNDNIIDVFDLTLMKRMLING